MKLTLLLVVVALGVMAWLVLSAIQSSNRKDALDQARDSASFCLETGEDLATKEATAQDAVLWLHDHGLNWDEAVKEMRTEVCPRLHLGT
jgi:hypothetical protein